MNPQQHLRSWSQEWDALRRLNALAPSEPETAGDVAGQTQADPSLTVGSAVASQLMHQLTGAIAPDLARQAEGHANAVLAGGPQKSATTLLKAGQILHLRHTEEDLLGRPLHVLVLRVDAAKARALVAPFGPLPIPATQAELLTGIDDTALAVLCLWNASWQPAAALVHGWEIARAEESLLADAAALRTALGRRESVPASLAARVGPPLVLPDDPRHGYLMEEEKLWSLLQADG